MHRRRVAVVLACLALAPLLAGCFGGDDTPNPRTADDAGRRVVDRTARLGDANATISLAPWVQDLGPTRDPPSLTRLAQLAYWTAPHGAMRLLSDGQAFVLVVDQSVAPLDAGTVVLARIVDSDTNATVARGAAALDDPDLLRVPVAVMPHEVIRFGGNYGYEVVLFQPTAAMDCDCTFTVAAGADGLVVGGFDGTTAASVASNAWNGTVLGHWSDRLSFRATWAISFSGPEAGTDRPDPLEDRLLGGPDTGAYVFTLEGERIWLVDVLLEFGRSRVHGTTPAAGGNGSSSLPFQVDGFRPLAAYLGQPFDKGLAQSFTLTVHVDYETAGDLPGEEDQLFLVTTAIGYRVGGSTYVAGTDGREVDVHVSSGT